jgi:hypothetical protein
MTPNGDTDGVLHPADDELDALLASGPRVADAGNADTAQNVAHLLGALREPARAHELAGTDELVRHITAAVRHDHQRPTPPARRSSVLTRILTAKVAAIAAATFV